MQRSVDDFLARHGLNADAKVRFIDLTSELGELGKELLKGDSYGSRVYENTLEIAGEVGDCLFSLLALCSSLGIDAEHALSMALDKYERRFAKRGEIGSGN